MDLYRSDSSTVATTVVKCLEFLSRRDAKREGAQGSLPEGSPPVLIAEDPIDAEDGRYGDDYQGGDYEVAEGDEQEDEEDEEDEEDGEDEEEEEKKERLPQVPEGEEEEA